MRAPPTEERQVVWEVLAQFWVDTWYDAEQLDQFADRLARCGFSIRELDRIAHREVCGAFATFTLAVFASAGMALPDWCFPEDQARRKVAALLSRPRLLSILNPFWAAGATVIARDGRFVATLTPAPDGLVQLGLYERPGRYRVEISRPGYRSQVLESVRVVEEGCNVQTVRVAAALAPAI